MMKKIWMAATLVVVLAACGGESEESKSAENPAEQLPWMVTENEAFSKFGPTRLSEHGFFEGELKNLKPSTDVYPYELVAPLFTDYAEKSRFVKLPENTVVTANDSTGKLIFPKGTVLIKNFYYTSEKTAYTEDKILETRLLVKGDKGWKSLPYLWNEEQTEAFLSVSGAARSVSHNLHGDFIYRAPTMTQCKSCHEYKGVLKPIGPSVQNWPKGGKNPLAKWEQMGIYSEEADNTTKVAHVDYADASHPLNDRARSYLDINCGHCHNPNGPAKNSGLDLSLYSPNAYSLGVYKSPIAAGKGSGGHQFDIVPGAHEKSILAYRMKSQDPGVQMPELGRSLVHREGVALIEEWIQKMESNPQ